MRRISLGQLRCFAVARQFRERTLAATLDHLGFVQADPIRAPARAQDLTLRQRVSGYCAGDLERDYARLPIEEDFFINYGFVSRRVSALMHPRAGAGLLPAASNTRARAVLAFIRERGEVHPRDVDAHFSHGRVVNYWGGSSSATTHLLEQMHYKGLVRVARRDRGIRIYAVHQHAGAATTSAERRARLDALVDIVVRKYAPLPSPSLSTVVRRLRYAVPQWTHEIGAALTRARHRLAQGVVDGVTWYWPADEQVDGHDSDDRVRFLAPFDPLVWDRRTFEALWGWAYRFEAYTPAPKRKLGYYALPMLWREHIIGWSNVTQKAESTRKAQGPVDVTTGFVSTRKPRDRAFTRALEQEIERLRAFLTPSRT